MQGVPERPSWASRSPFMRLRTADLASRTAFMRFRKPTHGLAGAHSWTCKSRLMRLRKPIHGLAKADSCTCESPFMGSRKPIHALAQAREWASRTPSLALHKPMNGVPEGLSWSCASPFATFGRACPASRKCLPGPSERHSWRREAHGRRFASPCAALRKRIHELPKAFRGAWPRESSWPSTHAMDSTINSVCRSMSNILRDPA
jgi:hypothetical protein